VRRRLGHRSLRDGQVFARHDEPHHPDAAANRRARGEHRCAGHAELPADDDELAARPLVRVGVNRRHVRAHPLRVDESQHSVVRRRRSEADADDENAPSVAARDCESALERSEGDREIRENGVGRGAGVGIDTARNVERHHRRAAVARPSDVRDALRDLSPWRPLRADTEQRVDDDARFGRLP